MPAIDKEFHPPPQPQPQPPYPFNIKLGKQVEHYLQNKHEFFKKHPKAGEEILQVVKTEHKPTPGYHFDKIFKKYADEGFTGTENDEKEIAEAMMDIAKEMVNMYMYYNNKNQWCFDYCSFWSNSKVTWPHIINGLKQMMSKYGDDQVAVLERFLATSETLDIIDSGFAEKCPTFKMMIKQLIINQNYKYQITLDENTNNMYDRIKESDYKAHAKSLQQIAALYCQSYTFDPTNEVDLPLKLLENKIAILPIFKYFEPKCFQFICNYVFKHFMLMVKQFSFNI